MSAGGDRGVRSGQCAAVSSPCPCPRLFFPSNLFLSHPFLVYSIAFLCSDPVFFQLSFIRTSSSGSRTRLPSSLRPRRTRSFSPSPTSCRTVPTTLRPSPPSCPQSRSSLSSSPTAPSSQTIATVGLDLPPRPPRTRRASRRVPRRLLQPDPALRRCASTPSHPWRALPPLPHTHCAKKRTVPAFRMPSPSPLSRIRSSSSFISPDLHFSFASSSSLPL